MSVEVAFTLLALFCIAILGYIIYIFVRLNKETKKGIKQEQEKYSTALKRELGTIHLLGSPDIESSIVGLQDAFVSLRISVSRRSEDRFDGSKNRDGMGIYEEEPPLSPEDALNRAFNQHKPLLIIGDPGSGKTTLLKYYALACLDKTAEEWKRLGFERKIIPLYFPLRELEFDENDEPVSIPVNLEKWFDRRLLNFSKNFFSGLLDDDNTLVLLDGLDEIGSKERRRKVCRWFGNLCSILGNTQFVVTSRAAGYRKQDGIELEMPHFRVDIMDFSSQQQDEFLKKWFRAAFSTQLPPPDMSVEKWKEQQIKKADWQSQIIISFLKKEENKAVRELAAVPMLLHIMAILWKERRYLPETRSDLYDASLNYLLEYRDRQKEIGPLLSADESRSILTPVALWMQMGVRSNEVLKEEMHKFMQQYLDKLNSPPWADEFCVYLRDRVGLIVDHSKDYYAFRHKSFREFLAAQELRKLAYETGFLEALIHDFGEDWWTETLRFFFNESDDNIFNRFMYLFFQADISKELNDHQQNLLQLLIKEAPQKKIDALKEYLNSDRINNNQRRYVLDCLKTIGTPEAIQTIETANNENWNKVNRAYADDIITEASPRFQELKKQIQPEGSLVQSSFRNPFEDNVEYINIPGGVYKFSVTGRIENIPGFYLCKYPVTNKRYRRFISFLAGREKELLEILPLEIFAQRLLKFATPIKGYTAFLGENFTEWQVKLPSRLDDDKKFYDDDQPVVAVSWYAARAYCFWLSCLDIAMRGDIENPDIHQLASIYRLPTEKEWEWAAAGREPGGSLRKYPWPAYKGEPNPNLANYNKNVGASTPVGHCPEGATPEGLMDMAGNAWEWMDNYYDAANNWYALRGGSWYDGAHNMRCAARSNGGPDYLYDVIGFRVLRTHS